jgi:ubiquinone/menaquinone biosynthesis C-methylase UbiE
MNSIAVQSPVKTKPANFDHLARVYRWLEWFTFGPILWRCRCTFLASMLDKRRALLIGDGDGRFTARLLESNSHVTIETLDASEAMLSQLLRNARENAGRVHARVADARVPVSFAHRFDLIVTHFFLDCLTTAEIESLASDLREKLAPGARWVISEFAVPESLYGRLFARPFISGLYLAFEILTGLKVRRLPLHRDALQRAGFVLVEQRKRLKGLLVSELWETAWDRTIPAP